METWTNLCRCCLSANSEVSLLDKEKNVTEKFYEVTTIKVKEDDCLPLKLCGDCYETMNSAYLFRKQCIKMNSELKLQLTTLLNQAEENENDTNSMDELMQSGINDDVEFANDPNKQLEAIIKQESNKQLDSKIKQEPNKQLEALIKQEPLDSDDDYYYVLVIDDPKDKEAKDNVPNIDNIKVEIEEPINEPNDKVDNSNSFDNRYESFLMTNKVPLNVPATILENEEETQDEDQIEGMVVDTSQNETSQIHNFTQLEESHGNISENNLIKILTTANSDGTILLKGNNGIQYLTDSQLVTNEDDDDSEAMSQEVIFCEGDESQFQILKYDGSELIIEYADEGQIATVLQQEDGTFLCDCGEQFEDLDEYEKHQYKHNPAGEHLCNLCGKGFESADILTGHMLLHSVTSLLITCPFCDQLIRRNSLTQHIKYSHNNIKPRCNVCLKTFANPNNLKRHMMIHSGVRDFECDICFKRFHQKITMQTHMLTHINPFACTHCEKTFENKADLNEHKESEDCDKTKVSKIKEEFMKTVKQEVTSNLGKLLGYACSLCKKMFSVESALEQHIENTHIVDPAELMCAECGEVLSSRKEMQTHMHTHKNYKYKNAKRFECSICGKGCSSQAMLYMHERVHTNERPFPCQLCSLRFKTKTHLRTHQLTHTREKKFGCSVCMKFFALKGNLVVHLRTHTGERPYICSVCGEAFIDSKYLKKHKLKKHSIGNVPWNQY